MKRYEIMFIVKSTIEAENVKKTAETYKKLVSELNGKVEDYKEMGEKKLAYAIKKELNGYYFVMTVEANNEAISEFDRKIRLDENVLRHLVIRLDEE
jgi:small subunit ribosomal protein S6